MNSRERVIAALNHTEPDRLPLDLGGSSTTGMHVSSVYRLRQALGLDAPGTPVKIIEPYQMLGEIGRDLVDALSVDVLPIRMSGTLFGYRLEGWKPWTLWDGTPVLVPAAFNTEPDPRGDVFQYPEGDTSVPPSGRMPRGGFYFDAVIRQPPIDWDTARPEDNFDDFTVVTDEDVADLKRQADALHSETDKAIFGDFALTSCGSFSRGSAPWLKHPRGIRDVELWVTSYITRPEFMRRIFERQCEVGLQSLEKIYRAVGDKMTVAMTSLTDFGMQQGLFISPRVYRGLFKPFHREVNAWVHAHTGWKTFIHSCGSVSALIDDFIEAGFDILNPVQCSAANMDPAELKAKFGDRIAFWGGGVDTQGTLPFGTADDVRREVAERIRIFGEGGGFVFNPNHNVQARVPVENLLAMYETVRRHAAYR